MTITRHDISTITSLLQVEQGNPGNLLQDRASAGSSTDWEAVTRFASAHLILPTLYPGLLALDQATPFPPGLIEFYKMVNTSNRERNCMFRSELDRIANALNTIGVEPIVLKGGAFLLENDTECAAWRFMADLDLLIPEADLAECVRICKKLGLQPVDEDYDIVRHAHYPPLISQCGRVSVELHTRLFARPMTKLGADIIIQAAELFNLPTSLVRRPALDHRFAHVLAHAQLHNGFYDLRRILFRDFVDLTKLDQAAKGRNLAAESGQYFQAGFETHAASSLLAAQRINAGQTLGRCVTAAQKNWARSALQMLSRPSSQRRVLALAGTARLELKRLFREPAGRSKRLAGLADPSRWANWLTHRRVKLRQMLWS